ncbi:hypothetical protein K439DRAFT_1402075 [Ramaria rubella]|nr:hypothetical protein K439DRAFT_1402075 [Ramaria rubella]
MAKRRNHKSFDGATNEEIPEAEQWRLINESGVLEKAEEKDESPDLADEVFNAILLIIPFSFLYLMMDILVHQQYGQHPSIRDYTKRLISAVPVLSIFIFYSNRHKPKLFTQIGLFLASVAAGTRLIWLVNRAPWHVTIRQGPPLATIWICTVVLLDLLPAVFGLALVAAWFQSTGMKIIF